MTTVPHEDDVRKMRVREWLDAEIITLTQEEVEQVEAATAFMRPDSPEIESAYWEAWMHIRGDRNLDNAADELDRHGARWRYTLIAAQVAARVAHSRGASMDEISRVLDLPLDQIAAWVR